RPQQLQGVCVSAQSRQCDGLTSTRLPALLIQPISVCRQGKTSACTSPSITPSCRSRSNGALSIGSQLHIGRPRERWPRGFVRRQGGGQIELDQALFGASLSSRAQRGVTVVAIPRRTGCAGPAGG